MKGFKQSILVIVSLFFFSSYAVDVFGIVRGQKYAVKANSVKEFLEGIESMTNLEKGQSKVLFRGKVLSPNDILSAVGVTNNESLMVIRNKQSKLNPKVGWQTKQHNERTPETKSKAYGSPLDDLGNSMKAMESLLDSNFIDEYFSDESKLEEARLQMLDNLDQYEKMIPGFKEQALEIAQDAAKWKAAMLQAKDQLISLKVQRDAQKSSADHDVVPEDEEDDNSVDDVLPSPQKE